MVDPSEAVYEFVRTIPAGNVVTYGQVAGLLEGVSLTPRQVGGIMASAPSDAPWQRVVGAAGHLPIGKRATAFMIKQRQLLEKEGVTFLPNDRIDMPKHQWLAHRAELEGLFK